MDYTREMQRGRGGEGYIYLCIIGCILQIYFPILVTNLIFNNATLKRIECLNTEAECMRRTHTFVIIKNKISVSHSFFYTNHCHLSDRKSSFSGIFLALSIILERCSLSFESTRFAANLYRKRSDSPSYK